MLRQQSIGGSLEMKESPESLRRNGINPKALFPTLCV